MAYTLTRSDLAGGVLTLSTVTAEEHTKDANLFFMAIPLKNSADALALDLFGTSKNITVRGVYSGTASQINTFIVELEKLISGDQSNNAIFNSDWGTGSHTYNALVQTTRFNLEPGAPGLVRWEIQLIEGQTVS